MRIGFFGAGNMAQALALGIIQNEALKSVEMFFFTPSKMKAKDLAHKVRGHFVENLEEMPKDLDWYFLGFKPQNLSAFHFDFKPQAKVVSMLAGTSLITLKNKFPQTDLVRIMPNTPSKVLKGMNLIYFSPEILSSDRIMFEGLLQSCGKTITLNSESDIDLLTPFSGSGPGVIFELAHYFEKAILKIAGDQYDARKIVAETFLGSAILMAQSNESFVELRDQVTSKKGVTFEALETLRNNNVDEIFLTAFKNAINRIEEMKRGV